MSTSRIFSIAPEAPFLPTLASALLEGTLFPDWPRESPFWLADITLYLPTRRARDLMADALVSAMGASPLLLPDIRALGGEDPEADPFLPPFAEPALPPPIGRTRRRLMLARLIEKWIASQPRPPFSAPGLAGAEGAPNAGEILALADSLATVFDDFAIAGLSPAALAEIQAEDLPANWQQALDFTAFVFEVWPAILAEGGEIEGAERTGLLLRRQAAALPHLFGARPVVVAGSTGSIPATADLIAAITRLERGAVVLPGLDPHLDPDHLVAHANPHGHPQYGLMRLLRRLQVDPEAVFPLGPTGAARTRIVATALALADDTASWVAAETALAPEIGPALDGVALVSARNPEEEARAIALAVRAALVEAPPRRVAVITPDQTLARRIAAELARFDIVPDDAAGTPLARSRAGRLVRQIVTLATGGGRDVDVMALLRNRHVGLGLTREKVARAADALDFAVLRGQRPAIGIEGLRQAVADNLAHRTAHTALRLDAESAAAVTDMLDALQAALAPVLALARAPFHAGEAAQALVTTLALLEAGAPAARFPGRSELTALCEDLIRHGGVGPRYTLVGLALALDGLMAGISVRPPRMAQARVQILGRLEARLIDADTMILAGLVEGVWPEIADPGPWMSRGMRLAVGLEPPERLHGLAAHDFLMASGAERLILTRSARAGTSPATPSRLLQRLQAFVGPERTAQMEARGRHWVTLARRLDLAPGLPEPARQPLPRPPLAARQKMMALSITEIETLIRSPYDLYAKYVLGLRVVPALGADPDAAERGSLIHAVFGRFIAEGHDPLAPEALDTLRRLAREAFAGLDSIPARRDIWLRRLEHAGRQFLAFETERAPGIAQRHAEIDGVWIHPPEAGGFRLRGRADRIDRRTDGRHEILDFKTGALPKPATMKALLAPQLPLEALMLAGGAFETVPPGPSAALTYVKIANGPEAFTPTPFATGDLSLNELVAATNQLLAGHVEALLRRDTLALAARLLPDPDQRYLGAYDHLARTEEWTLIAGGDEP